MPVNLKKEKPTVNLKKETAPSPEEAKQESLDGVRNALEASSVNEIIAGGQDAWTADEAALMRDLLEKAQDRAFSKERNKEMSSGEIADFADAMASYLHQQEKAEEDRTIAKGLRLQQRGAWQLRAGAKAVEKGSAASIREYLDNRLKEMSLKGDGTWGRERAFAGLSGKGNWGVGDDNQLGYDIYTEERAEAYFLLETIENNPAGARNFLDQVQQGAEEPRPPRMESVHSEAAE